MNTKMRNEIIELALKHGLTRTENVAQGHTITDYAGSGLVDFNGKVYKCIGRTSKWHSMSFTQGYVHIQRTCISRGLQG